MKIIMAKVVKMNNNEKLHNSSYTDNNSNETIDNYPQAYKKISSWITKKSYRFKILNLSYTYLPYIFVISYIYLVVSKLLSAMIENNYYLFAKIVLIPSVAFILLSIVRKFINFPRPYEKYNITPLIQKSTKGKSMPSRHTFSACIIACTWFYVCHCLGIILLILSFFVALTRILAGVHFVKDNIVSIILGIITGSLFYIL